jgi:hypothetical protein
LFPTHFRYDKIPISKSVLNNRYFYSGFFDKKLLSWRALFG